MPTISTRKVPFLDLRVPENERKEILHAIDTVLQHGRLVIGPEVNTFESCIAEYCSKKFGVGMNSGTDSLFLALKALDIGPGDEVITTSLSWIATANAIALTGARPVFADISDDLNIEPKSVLNLISTRTKAILPVHYTGKVCDMNALQSISEEKQIPLVEDAAQAFGATYRGKPAGSFGQIACFSMNPMKILGACGEAGIVLTNDPSVHERLICLRYNGTINKEQCVVTSLNCRLDTLQAAILLYRLKNVSNHIDKRRSIAAYYNEHLVDYVTIPKEMEGSRDIYYTYTIRTSLRDKLKSYLEERGIEVKIQHPYLMCQQPIYKQYLKQPVPNAEKIVREILCLPIHEKLTLEDLDYVVSSIRNFFS